MPPGSLREAEIYHDGGIAARSAESGPPYQPLMRRIRYGSVVSGPRWICEVVT